MQKLRDLMHRICAICGRWVPRPITAILSWCWSLGLHLLAISNRLFLIAAVFSICLLLAFGLAYLITAAPGLLILAILASVFLARRRFRFGQWTFGTARTATPGELARAGVLSAESGLLIGKVEAPRIKDATRLLFRLPLTSSAAASQLFVTSITGQRKGMWARLNRGVHTVAFAPTGRGKGTGLVVPNLMTYPGSVVVTDPKGENAILTAEYRRRRFGHEIVILDPYRIVTKTPDTFNILGGINKSSPLALDDVEAISEALVVRTGEEKEPHWCDSAQLWISAVTSLVLQEADPETRNLQTVAKILADPLKLNGAVEVMKHSDAWDGMLARLGELLQHYVDRELGSTLTTTNRFLRFLNTMAVAESTRSSSFDPAGLRSGRMSIYLVLPSQYLRTQSPLLRLWISGLLRAVISGGPDERTKTLWILDEAASLGHLPCLDDAVERLRGYGTRLFFLYQSMGQLEQCFPGGRAHTFLSNMDNTIFFGVNDPQTASAVSERLGTSTVPTWSESGGSSRNRNHDAMGQSSRSYSSNDGFNIGETGRKLMTPDEVINLNERQAIVFTPGVRPFIARLVRYYEREFRSAPGGSRTIAALCLTLRGLLVASILAGSAFIGLGMISEASRRAASERQPLPNTMPYWNRQEQTSPWTVPGAGGLSPFQKGVDGNAPENRSGPRGGNAPPWPEGAAQRAESFKGVRRR
jgi:type IV secretion system protein VirD4